MKKLILIIIIVGMVGYATYEFMNSSSSKEDMADTNGGAMITSPPADEDKAKESDRTGLSKGDMAPDFELETLDGKTVHLSDFKGERVLVNFWATWCPPCRAEIPDLEKLYQNKDVTILATNLTMSEENENKVTDFVDEFGMSFPVLKDSDGDVSATYQVQAYPTSYMIDSNGRIQFIQLGPMNYDQMVQELENMK
ncbi:TlpA disulfide reductase family protein [Lentibacillus sp. N15]|uniref:TlpA family protein disulfide reductase n=1 Tax=Lentibacillus songyuanensis TaxID=3136161 RepID=UPI0031BADB0B